VPLVSPLNSSRRYQAGLAQAGGALGPLQADWLKRLARVEAAAAQMAADTGLKVAGSSGADPRQQHPWPLLRGVCAGLLAAVRADEAWADERGATLLTDILRLEVDAWQERISKLAGNINPFRVESVARVLPLLNRADAEIRDLRQMTGWLAERDFESAFIRPQARWRETLDEKDWGHLIRDLQSRQELAGLARLAIGLAARPILLPQLATGIRRIMDLSAALVDEGVRDDGLDLLTASLLGQAHHANGQIAFAVEKELSEAIAAVLPAHEAADHPLRGI